MSRNVIVTPNPAIAEAFASRFLLPAADFPSVKAARSYANGRIVLLVTDESIPFAAISAEFLPERLYFADFADSATSERRLGDVLLPNAFYPVDPAIRTAEAITEENRNSFGAKSAEFLEHYPVQGDYDFGSFGLSVGGICVSSETFEDDDALSRINTVYGADIVDRKGYFTVRDADLSDMKSSIYPLYAVTGGIVGEEGSISAEKAAHNLAAIFVFLEDSFGGSPHAEDDGVTTEETDLTDDDHE